MRSIWSGAISFGLVNIPVKLYSPVQERQLNFDLLSKEDYSPIKYLKVRRSDGKEVSYRDIVKGYEYAKGDYVILTEEDFKKTNVKKTKTIEIVDFAQETDIDSMLFDKPYYLEPAKGAEKAYSLLREALRRSKRVGVARFVLRTREHLGVIKPEGKVIVLNQLRYKDEIRDPNDLKIPEQQKLENREIELALKLIDELTKPFKPEAYKDTYTEELKEVIQKKAEGKEIVPKGNEPEPTEIPDLMAVLRKSLEQARDQEQPYGSRRLQK